VITRAQPRSATAAAATAAGLRALDAARRVARCGDHSYARTTSQIGRLALRAAKRGVVDDAATQTLARLACAAAAIANVVADVRAAGGSALDPSTDELLARCSRALQLMQLFLDKGGEMTRDFRLSVSEIERDAATWIARRFGE
jgi:hypothetical protein